MLYSFRLNEVRGEYFMISKEITKIDNLDQSVNYFIKNGTFLKPSVDEYVKGPLISVIITTFNRSDLLDRAIKSLQFQTYSNIEIIVVDDNSTDFSTIDVLTKWDKESNYPFYYFVNKENSGPSISRKNGIKKANGDFVVFMDDDDFYINVNSFKMGIEKFNKYPDLSFVSGDSLLEYKSLNELKFKPLNYHGFIKKEDYLPRFQISYNKPRSTFSTIFSKSKLEQSGAFEMEMFNDSSIYMRALLVGDAFLMDEIWGVYYIHETNISKTIDAAFIVKNMREKHEVYTIMVANGYKYPNWMVKQFNLTIDYLFSGTNMKNNDILLEWINSIEDKGLRRQLKFTYYRKLSRNNIKKLIKG